MKKIMLTFAMVISFAFILSPFAVFAAGNAEADSLTGAQVTTGIVILIIAITIPIMKRAHKSKPNK